MTRLRLQADGEPAVLLTDLAAECAALLAEQQQAVNGPYSSGRVVIHFSAEGVKLGLDGVMLGQRKRRYCKTA